MRDGTVKLKGHSARSCADRTYCRPAVRTSLGLRLGL